MPKKASNSWRQKRDCDIDGFQLDGYNTDYIECGEGRSHSKARADVAYRAFMFLREHGYIKSKFESAVGEPIYEESTRQVNELFQKKLIGKPEYEFSQEYDEDGNPYWYCSLAVDGYEKMSDGEGDTKKEAQRDAAYIYLCYIMGIEIEDDEDE